MKKIFLGILTFIVVVYALLALREGSYTADTNVVINVKDAISSAYVPASVSIYPHLKTPKSVSASGRGHYIFSLGSGMPALMIVKAPGYHTKIRLVYLKPDETKIVYVDPK